MMIVLLSFGVLGVDSLISSQMIMEELARIVIYLAL
jgi:hypothetical protein